MFQSKWLHCAITWNSGQKSPPWNDDTHSVEDSVLGDFRGYSPNSDVVVRVPSLFVGFCLATSRLIDQWQRFFPFSILCCPPTTFLPCLPIPLTLPSFSFQLFFFTSSFPSAPLSFRLFITSYSPSLYCFPPVSRFHCRSPSCLSSPLFPLPFSFRILHPLFLPVFFPFSFLGG